MFGAECRVANEAAATAGLPVARDAILGVVAVACVATTLG